MEYGNGYVGSVHGEAAGAISFYDQINLQQAANRQPPDKPRGFLGNHCDALMEAARRAEIIQTRLHETADRIFGSRPAETDPGSVSINDSSPAFASERADVNEMGLLVDRLFAHLTRIEDAAQRLAAL